MDHLKTLIATFLTDHDAAGKDQVWKRHSEHFRAFWSGRIMAPEAASIPEAECDEIIRILDRNGKGNTKGSEAVAKAMVPQGAWRRMFNELHANKALGRLLNLALAETEPAKKAEAIDQLYRLNAAQRNNLTGPSGNAVGAFLAAHDPEGNLSIISLKDRRAIIEYLGLPVSFDWDTSSVGTRIALTNGVILAGARALGLKGSARTISMFFYVPQVKALWKGEHTVRRIDKEINVSVPTVPDDEEDETAEPDLNVTRESMQIQGLIARIGTLMGFSIWLPKADRSRVLKVWSPEPGALVNELPFGFDRTTMATIEQIDVLWLRRRSIVRAFEVEHTTSVYSGLLRMADLVALQPNINIKLHIVAAAERREKVLREIRRPVFSLLEGCALAEMCTYLSYDQVREIGDLKHLAHLSDKVLEDYEESAGSPTDAP
jgi:hypothetical protein